MNFESGSILTQFRRVYNSISVLLLSLFVPVAQVTDIVFPLSSFLELNLNMWS